jgi:hypothetical protein
MLKHRTLIVFLMVIGVFGIQAVVHGGDFKPSSEPHGFRGIEWGRDISTLKDITYHSTESISTKGLVQKLYTRKNEVLKIGTAQIQSIHYYFWKRKLYSVQINVKGLNNYNRLKAYCFKKYGKLPPDTILGYFYDWIGNITTARLGYNPRFKSGSLELTSVIIQKDVFDNLRNF